MNLSMDTRRTFDPVPAFAGVGLKGEHRGEFITSKPELGWVEIHAENYLGQDALGLKQLQTIRHDYHVSVHGVGLSLGSVDPINFDHLRAYKKLIERIDPFLVSEHLSWSSFGGAFLNDLLPLPYTEEAFQIVSKNVTIVQDFLQRKILIENPSIYVAPAGNEMDEVDFLKRLSRKTGCGILLDVNNVYVTSENLGLNADRYIERMLSADVEEIHLAGHARREFEGRTILIDDHGSAPTAPVWDLFYKAVNFLGPRPTLIEWDNNVPALSILLKETRKADEILTGLYYVEKSRVCA